MPESDAPRFRFENVAAGEVEGVDHVDDDQSHLAAGAIMVRRGRSVVGPFHRISPPSLSITRSVPLKSPMRRFGSTPRSSAQLTGAGPERSTPQHRERRRQTGTLVDP
jgi:hypothetical protein